MTALLFAALATPFVTASATAAPRVTVDVAADEASDRIERLRNRPAPASAVGAGSSSAGSPNMASYPLTFEGYTDPWFDAYWARGDIVEYGMGMYADGLTLVGVSVALFESPYSINWEEGQTGIIWDIDVNGDLISDYYAGLVNFEGYVGGAVLTTAGDAWVCDVEFAVDPYTGSYVVGFPTACLGSPSSVRFRAAMGFEDYPDVLVSLDQAPDNGGWAGPVFNDANLPPASPPPAPPAPACTPQAAGTPVTAAEFASLVPARLLDTRSGFATIDCVSAGGGARGAGSITEIQITGRAGIPADATAVVLNVAVTEAQGPGYITVFPCGENRPNAANLNYDTGTTIPNAVIAKIGAGGKVCVFTLAGTHLVADVNGFYPAGASYMPLTPTRLLETGAGLTTADGQSGGTGILPAGSVIELQVAGRGGVAADATAVVLNVAVTEPEAPGFITVFPCGESRPNAANLNYVTGQTIPNAVIAKIGAGGKVCLFSQAATHIVADMNGYYPAGATFVPTVPARFADTRPGMGSIDGQAAATGIQGAGTVLELHVAGRGGVPVDATAVVLNVAVTEAQGAGFITVFPCGESRPNAANLNYVTGQTIPNAVIAKIGAGGRVCLFTLAATHLVADVNGYYPAT